MKELSIEEKARRYDEALERARKFYNNEECRVGMTPVDLEVIFPELKELEDETIRGELINFFTNTENGGWCLPSFETRKSWIAWLEKQGDKADKVKQQQAIEIPFGTKDSELQEATYYIPDGYHAEINGNEVVIKKGEQKPVDKVEPKFKVGDWITIKE